MSEEIDAVETVLERWRMRSIELRKTNTEKLDATAIANSYDDLRWEIEAALEESHERPAVANGALAALLNRLLARKHCVICGAFGYSKYMVHIEGMAHRHGPNDEIICELEAALQQPAEAAAPATEPPPASATAHLSMDDIAEFPCEDAPATEPVCECPHVSGVHRVSFGGCGIDDCACNFQPNTEGVCDFAHNQRMGIFDCDFDEGRDDCNVHPGERVQPAEPDENGGGS